MCFPTCSLLGSFFLVSSFILELFLLIGQVSNQWFLRKIYFAEAWNQPRNLSYSFGLWNYCTGDASRNIQSCSGTRPAYNWARTPNIVDAVPNLANSRMASGLFYGLFILIFISMGLNFIFWIMSIPVTCTRNKRRWGYSMTTLCLINFLITLVCLILSLVLVLAGIRQLTGAGQNWNAHAGNALWIMIGVCISNLAALFCFSGGTCFSKKSSRDSTDDEYYYNDQSNKKRTGCFGCCGKRQKESKISPADKSYHSSLPTTNTGTNNNYHGTNSYSNAVSTGNYDGTNTTTATNNYYNSNKTAAGNYHDANTNTYTTNNYNGTSNYANDVSSNNYHGAAASTTDNTMYNPNDTSQMLQRPYVVSHGVGSPGANYNQGLATKNRLDQGVTDSSVSTPHVYQTPVLQQSNLYEH